MVQFNKKRAILVGSAGELSVRSDDDVARKLIMLIEGECEGLGPIAAAKKHGYSKQRYFQLRQTYLEQGATALANQKRGPKSNYRRTRDVVHQIIRLRFLDPLASPDVIAQKLRQLGQSISTRSVERVIADYGLQKKTSQVQTKSRRR